jgi:hypothetical protein
MEIYAITVCVNYADILSYMLKQNSLFIKKWYIVTSPEDDNTKKLIEDENMPNIELLIYTNFYKNARFNKGGAIRFAQEHIYKNNTNLNILILDADIYLPDNFPKILPEKLEDNTMYGTSERIDYWTVDDFINNTNPKKYPHGGGFVGFFQLYKQDSYKFYNNSNNCANCDNDFRSLFNNKIKLELLVKHLGKEYINWNGRVY